MSRARSLALLVATASLAWSAAARGQTVRPDFYVTNGTVNAQALSGTTLYVGGSFTHVGAPTGSGVPVDTLTGVARAGFPVVNGQILAAVPDGAGGWYVGGSFSDVGGVARQNAARVLADGTVSPWNPATNGVVRALAVSGGTVYLGGEFTTLAGQPRERLAAVDTAAGTPAAWNPGANNIVRTLVVRGGSVLVGGQFTVTGGQARNRVAALDVGTGTATSWNPNANSTVFALATAGSVIYAGGQFTTVGGQVRNRLAALDPATGLAIPWNPNANGPVLALAAGEGTLYAGGSFSSVGGQVRNRLAALDAATGLATPWNPNAGGTVQCLAARGGTVYAGGDFTTVGGEARSRVAALSAATGLATAWDPVAYGTVSVVALDGAEAFVGGLFSAVGGLPRANLAAFDVGTGQATAWDPGTNGSVQALALGHGMVYAGGAFTQAGGLPRGHVAALDTTAGAASGWDPGTDGIVTALDVHGDAVYVGGLFSVVSGQPRASLAAVDAGTGLATAWDPGADDQVFAIAHGAGGLYVGGSFTTVGGAARSFVAALDPVTGLATPWAPEANGTVRALVDGCDRVYAGGFFTAIGGQTRDRIAALDPATALATPWDPDANGPVYAIALDDGVAYVGGVLNVVGGYTRNRIAALDPVTGLATPWDPNCGGTIRSVVAGGGWVYAAGTFTAMGDTPSGNLAAVTADAGNACPAITLVPPPPATGVVGTPYVQSLAAGGGTPPYCYAVTAGNLPAGLALSAATGEVSGTPLAAGTGVFTVTARDARGCAGAQSYTLTIFPAPAVSSIAAAGEGICITPDRPCVAVPFVYTRGDSVPLRAVGVTFQLDTTRLSLCTPGAPAASVHAGAWLGGFTNTLLQVTDHGGGAYTVDQTLLGQPCGITGGGELFTVDLAAVGPEGAGAIDVTSVRVRDCANAPVAADAGPPSSVNVLGTSIAIVPTTLPGAEAGTPYSQALGASAGTPPFAFAVTAGALPAGLVLTSGGIVSGTPAQTGAFVFTVTATDADGCGGSAACSLAVDCAAIAVLPPILPDGVAGLPYSQPVTASAGVAPFRFAVTAGALPDGLDLSGDGLLSGTPPAAGTSVFTIGVTDTAGCTATTDYVLDVYATPPASSVAANTAGLCISTAHPCVSVPFEYTRGDTVPARGLKVGFTIDPAMLALCTPESPAASVHAGSWFAGHENAQLLVTDGGGGTYTVDAVLLGEPCGIATGGVLFTVDLRSVGDDGEGAIAVGLVKARDCANVAIPVMAGAPAALRVMNTPVPIAPATLPDALVGRPYEQALAAEAGVPPFTFTLAAGELPPGVTLSPAGLVSGTPLATGSYAFTVGVTDALDCPGSRGYTLVVGCPAVAVSPVGLPEAVVGMPYGVTLKAEGSLPPLAWAVSSGSLPGGLGLDPVTGALTGTPLAAGVAVFTVTATDSAGCAAAGSYTLPVFTTPSVSSVAAGTAGLCLSSAHPRVSVPVSYTRADSIPARGASVTFTIDTAKLALCTPGVPDSSIRPGTWLAGFASAGFQVTDRGGGTYTVDQAILGTPCGVTGGGQLFTVDLRAAGGDGSGAIEVAAVAVRGCDNLPIGAVPGPVALLTVDDTAPDPVTDLAAAPVLAGNPAGPTLGIALTWSTGGAGSVRLYRAPFAGYPLYDALEPFDPPDPAAAPGPPWALVSDSAVSGIVDRGAPRGFWHYVALVESECGVLSTPSNLTAGTLDYLLGDVSDAVTRGSGNGRVGMEDVTLLGAHYGIDSTAIAARGVAYLDVGPTAAGAPDGRPFPDRTLDFEDLFVFATNFGADVTAPALAAPPPAFATAGARDAPEELRLEAPALVEAGQTVTASLVLRGEGRVQGMSVRLGWDADVVEPVDTRTGALVLDQGGIVLAPRPGTVDAVLLGRRAVGFLGEGEVAAVTFRARRAGAAGIGIAGAVLRDPANRDVPPGEVTLSSRPERPGETRLLAPAPNPLRGEVALAFALAEPGPVELVVYAVDGRRVRALASSRFEAGVHRAVWDARDDSHRPVPPGVYFARLTAGGRRFTATMVRLR